MKNELIIDYLLDTIKLLKDDAIEARKERLEKADDYFIMGTNFGYYSVLLTLIRQAEVFGIPLNQLGLDNINPEKDLMGLSKKQ